jgi:DNA-directed RNA polymerase specialized sigma24 family protein
MFDPRIDIDYRLVISDNYEDVDWEKVIHVLMAFAYKLIGDNHYLINKSKEEYAYDFTLEAVKRYLQNPSKFDPSRNPDLVLFLKYNILRQLIQNSKLSGYQSKSVDIEDKEGNNLIEALFLDEYDSDENLDVSIIVSELRKRIEKKRELLDVFELKYYKEFSPSEICETLEISYSEYNNRMKRLRRIFNKLKPSSK